MYASVPQQPDSGRSAQEHRLASKGTWIRAHALRGRIRGKAASSTAQEQWAAGQNSLRAQSRPRGAVPAGCVSSKLSPSRQSQASRYNESTQTFAASPGNGVSGLQGAAEEGQEAEHRPQAARQHDVAGPGPAPAHKTHAGHHQGPSSAPQPRGRAHGRPCTPRIRAPKTHAPSAVALPRNKNIHACRCRWAPRTQTHSRLGGSLQQQRRAGALTVTAWDCRGGPGRSLSSLWSGRPAWLSLSGGGRMGVARLVGGGLCIRTDSTRNFVRSSASKTQV